MALGRVLRAQMTVEFVVVFPVALAIALVAVNATLFFSECASFDRAFRTAVCTYAPSPAAGQDTQASAALVQGELDELFSAEHLDLSVSVSGVAGGVVTFTGELRFSPTLFGSGALTGAFGVDFVPLCHTNTIAVDVYKPGVFL